MSNRVCVIGAGKWGKNHVKTLQSLGALAAVVDSRESVRGDLAAQFPGIRVYSDHRDAVEDGYDGFVVATPAETHASIAEFLLARKRHVLVEKPLALSSADARRLVKLAAENGVNLMVGHVLLFHPAVRKIKELIDNGKLGRLEYL